jgi:hypothetical protein
MEESSKSTPFNDWSWQTPIFYNESLEICFVIVKNLINNYPERLQPRYGAHRFTSEFKDMNALGSQ